MDLNCTKCSSEQTQKITAIVSGGTTHSIGRTNSVGVAAVGGKLALGSSSGTTRSTSTSELAKKLAAPYKRSESFMAKFIFATVAVAAITFSIGFLWGVVITGGFGYWLFTKLKKQSDEAIVYNRDVFPEAARNWENGFYCHRCENVFVPAAV